MWCYFYKTNDWRVRFNPIYGHPGVKYPLLTPNINSIQIFFLFLKYFCEGGASTSNPSVVFYTIFYIFAISWIAKDWIFAWELDTRFCKDFTCLPSVRYPDTRSIFILCQQLPDLDHLIIKVIPKIHLGHSMIYIQNQLPDSRE